MSIITAFVKNMDKHTIWLLEGIERDWQTAKSPYKDVVLCAIINEKLKRYEQEY